MNHPDDPDASVRHLLKQPRPVTIDAARAARVHTAVHAAWKDTARGSRHWSQWAGLAAAAVLVVGLAFPLTTWLRERGTPQSAPVVASALFVTSEVTFQIDGQPVSGGVGASLKPGTRIATNGGHAAIALPNGIELRLDSNTDLTIDTDQSLSLASGAVYLDSSRRTAPPETVAIAARGTVIRNLGTRYEVRLTDQELRVRVRDGRVKVESAFGMREADPGGQLSVTRSGIVAGRAAVSGADWDWIVRAVRPPQIEGRPLPEFLAWAEREGGREIRFSDASLERANATTIVYGAIERLTVDEAIDVVLSSCGLSRRIDGDVITIVEAEDTSAASGGVSRAK